MATKKLQLIGSFGAEVDSTLTQAGQAADAKVTGDALNQMQANIDKVSDLVGDSSVADQIANKADIEHSHNDLYYTEAEIDSKVDELNISINSKADSEHEHNDVYYTETEVDAKMDSLQNTISVLESSNAANYNESIIGLSVDGQVITYIKGDGSTHTIVTQDTDTTYSLATDATTGLTKLYATTGSAEDGTMTQKAIKTELDKKVGVSVDESQDTLVFTI